MMRLCVVALLLVSVTASAAPKARKPGPPPPPPASSEPAAPSTPPPAASAPPPAPVEPAPVQPAAQEPAQPPPPSTPAEPQPAPVREIQAQSDVTPPPAPEAKAQPKGPARPVGALAPPPWAAEEGSPDVAMKLAARTPLDAQPWALLGIESGVPVALSVVGAVAGAAVGAAGAWLVYRRARDVPGVPASAMLGGAALVALMLGTAGLVAGDAVLNAGHVKQLWLGRLIGFLVMAPVPVMLGAYSLWLAVGYYRLGPITGLTLSILALAGFGAAFVVLPVAALGAFAVSRGVMEWLNGSVMRPKKSDVTTEERSEPVTQQ